MNQEKKPGFKHSVDVSFQYFAGKPILRKDAEDPTRYLPAFVDGALVNGRGLYVFIDKRVASSFIEGKSYRARGVVLYREGSRAAYFCPFMEKVYIEAGLSSSAYPTKTRTTEPDLFSHDNAVFEPDARGVVLSDHPSLNQEY